MCLNLGPDAKKEAEAPVGDDTQHSWVVHGGAAVQLLARKREAFANLDDKLGAVGADGATNRGEVPNGKWIEWGEGQNLKLAIVLPDDRVVECDAFTNGKEPKDAIFDICKKLVVL